MRIHKAMTNTEVSNLLRAVSSAYQIKDEDKNKFRIIAYDRAADAVEHLSSEAKDLWDEGKLQDVAGIGESISRHLDEIFRAGKSKHFEKVMKGIPEAVFELIPLPGLGPSSSVKLVKALKIGSRKPLDKLLSLAKKGKIEDLPGFGKDSQDAIIQAIEQYRSREKRLLLNYATEIATSVIAWMKKEDSVIKIDPLGSVRRKASTIGDIDISVATEKPKKVIEHFTNYPKKQKLIEKGEHTASILLPGGVQVDLMVQPPESYGSLLQHFTGSKHHNIALRDYAKKKGMSLSEYGIKPKVKGQKAKVKSFRSEEEFYKFLGMDWIPPELREDTGEIEAAQKRKLPKLIELSDIKADLQIHSDFDIETSHDLGESSMQELVKKADNLGYEYIAFTEHNPSKSGHNDAQIIDLLKRKKEKVAKLNANFVKKMKNVKKVFNSLEIDILPNGKLPVPDKGLELLDFVLVAIHSSFKQTRDKMTTRIINALKHPKIKIFAHPTARKLNEREGVEINWEKLFDYCRKNKKWLEINADSMRLDLPDMLVKDAINNKVMLTLGTDSHNADCLDFMAYGVSVARRGWAEAKDVVNSRSLEEFEKMLQ